MTSKRGADALQQQPAGGQLGLRSFNADGMAPTGMVTDDTLGGTSYMDQAAVQALIRSVLQGDAGADNRHSGDHFTML